jgi:hypothetical protein
LAEPGGEIAGIRQHDDDARLHMFDLQTVLALGLRAIVHPGLYEE